MPSEVGIISLCEVIFGPLLVFLAGFETPPVLTFIGGGVILLSLIGYFSVMLVEEKNDNLKQAQDNNNNINLNNL